jgi:DNA-binding transcriptional ArsR family regulator
MDKFSALADPTRRQIIELLAGRGELSATAISDQFQMSAPAVSQHLKVLREAQLVRMEKRGQQRIYRLDPGAMTEFETWVHRLAAQMEDRFARLDEILEAEQKKEKGKRKK